MRNRNKLQTYLRWRRLKKEMLSEACYHAFWGTSDEKDYYWRYFERLNNLSKWRINFI